MASAAVSEITVERFRVKELHTFSRSLGRDAEPIRTRSLRKRLREIRVIGFMPKSNMVVIDIPGHGQKLIYESTIEVSDEAIWKAQTRKAIDEVSIKSEALVCFRKNLAKGSLGRDASNVTKGVGNSLC